MEALIVESVGLKVSSVARRWEGVAFDDPLKCRVTRVGDILAPIPCIFRQRLLEVDNYACCLIPPCVAVVVPEYPTPPTSNPARPGRTATSSRSTAGYETNASTSKTSPTSSKPESSSKTGDANTITTGHTGHSTDKPPPPTLPTTKQTQQPNTHNTWTHKRVPVKPKPA